MLKQDIKFLGKLISEIKFNEKRFGINELTHKFSNETQFKIYEVGISYNGRTYLEGKKLELKMLLEQFIVFKYSFFERSKFNFIYFFFYI